MRMLEANDAIATSTNLLNLLPVVVRSLLRTAVLILGKTEVMRFLVSRETLGPSGHVYSTGASGCRRRVTPGPCLGHGIAHTGLMHAMRPA